MGEKFWIEDPAVLVKNLRFFPTSDMTLDEKLNSLTRLVLIVTAVLVYLKFKYRWIFLLSALLIIAFLRYGNCVRENFTISPTYKATDLHQTTVSPTYAEEWQVIPPAYDLYSQFPEPKITDTFQTPLDPRSYPYGQYMTRTNILPSDEYKTHLMCGGVTPAREYWNHKFIRDRLAFQDNMTRLHKKKLDRRFRNNANDTFSPYNSY